MTEARGPGPGEGLRARLVAMLVALLAAAVLAAGAIAVVTFNQAVEPELAKRTRLIGSVVRTELQRALDVGVQLDAMAGLDAYLAETLSRFGEVERIAVVDAAGRTISEAQRAPAPARLHAAGISMLLSRRQNAQAFPIVDGNRLVGEIRIDTRAGFVESRLADVFLDIVVLAMVAVLMAVELAVAIAVLSVGKPLERIQRLLERQAVGDFLHRIGSGGIGSLGRTAQRLNDRAQDLAERLAALPARVRDDVLASREFRIATGRPAMLRLSDVGDIRPALFMFSVATEVSVSFLPVFARAAERPAWLPLEFAAAAPLMAYLVALAVLAPFAGALARRHGPRRLFLASVPPAALALAALGFSDSVPEIVFWRVVMASFYALATIACQEYALRADAGRGATRSIGTFLAVVYAGVFCGSALGGVIAGRFGFGAAFLTGALLAGIAGAIGVVTMRGSAGDPAVAAARGEGDEAPAAGAMLTAAGQMRAGAGGAAAFRFDPRFVALLLGAAVPMSTATAVFVWYLTPLMLAGAGSGPAEIARVVMLYYLPVVLLGAIVTRWADGRIGPKPLVLAGAGGSGVAMLSLTAWHGFWPTVLAVCAFGICHTLMRAPLYTLADRLAGGSPGARSALRLFERAGAIAGLSASAWFLPLAGPQRSIGAMGVVVLAGIGAYALAEIAGRAHTGQGEEGST
ncbi:MFS transporter [Burkholderiaceae bacterium FT117]|uniref:MFS transporter n=1 Tax=Zeimonas sediminis TaxID=2944268 RepID=UPI002342CD1A|nr:MFS transporter [Zeimonas sediminis]MCM5571572.1 MFS transporter [Zeimonas sediminis]